jgi:hypothetical protein
MAALALAALVAAAPGCRKMRGRGAFDDGQLRSVVNVADPRAAIQLTRGFHVIENDSWRWTMKEFSVTLKPPKGSAQNGAKLQMKFAIPDVIFNRLGEMTVAARINGMNLGAQKYTQAGEGVYEREVPASALRGDAVSVDFTVDKGLPPSEQDERELALVVTSVGLVPK